MIQEAHRLSHLSEYYFSKKLDQVREMNLKGLDVINLGIGSPDLAPSAETLQATMCSLQNPQNHGYPSYRGLVETRKAYSDWYQSTYKVQLDANKNVLPLLGSKEGLFYLAMAYLNPGDQVLLPNPGYPAYTSIAQLVGAEIIYYELSEKNNWYPDFKKISDLNLPRLKMMVANYPHMPSGQPATKSVFNDLIHFAKTKKILLVHDNPYSQVLNETDPQSILSFDKNLECCVELNSMSKAFNMAGWRAGVLCGANSVIEAVLKVKSNVDTGQFMPIQHGIIQALQNPEAWHVERNEVYRKRRVIAYEIFDRLGFSFNKNQVGLFVWAKAPDKIKDVPAFLDIILNQARVFITPGIIFGTAGERYARSSLCVSESRFQEAVTRLKGAHFEK